jgi:hypothetical protein
LRTSAFLLCAALAVAACQAPSPPVPMACVGDTTVYTRADTSNGVVPAMPRVLVAPRGTLGPQPVTVAALVGVDGHPERGRSRIVVSGGSASDQVALDAIRSTTFTPATRGGCAVRSWYAITYGRFGNSLELLPN